MHPFMGIEHWNRVGLSVADSAKRLHRLGFIDRQLMRIEAGHMPARPEYEVKGALGRMVWEDAHCCDQLRSRCRQLRMSVVAFDKCPDPALQRATDKTLESENTLALFTALFEVIKPAQIEAIRRYIETAQPLVDHPTIQLLRHQLIDRQAQVSWGISALAELAQAATKEELALAARWRMCIQGLLDAAGGVDGTQARVPFAGAKEVPSKPFALPDRSVRDSRFRHTPVKFHQLKFEDSVAGRFERMMYNRFFEMSPAEAVAYIHFSKEGMPWDFYYDTARHLWDEVRHSWFGEAILREKGYDITAAPLWTGWYDMTANLFEGDEAYIHLTVAIEKAAMKYPPGKREDYEFCRDVAKEPLMTTFQDFDWADEVVHAGYGQKWIVNGVFNGDSRKAKEAAEATKRKRQQFMAGIEGKAIEGKADAAFDGGY